ncbi:MAG: DUF362 domain-containing protein [Anaerolineae bacterium]|nr:DUF362 domain-containing protein [Anaerolineae bacterium]MDW8099803.1 DUF362 domain-containing protein [Anaerolineae bacterium]
MSTVALTRGNSRYEAVRSALDALGPMHLHGRRQVLIKPNLVSVTRQLASTHVDALRATLDWLRERYDGPITIGEGSALASSFEGYRHFGYESLAATYNVRFVDLNADERTVPVQTFDHRLQPQTLELSATAAESDFLISVGPPKTHDFVIMTAAIKNVVMGTLISRSASHAHGGPIGGLGSLYAAMPAWVKCLPVVDGARFVFMRKNGSHKMRIHQSYPLMHLNIFLVARVVRAHLAVIDAWEAMEGEGPTLGDPVPLHAAIASLDPVAADAAAARLMGFDPLEIGYLWYAHRAGLGQGDLRQVQWVGDGDLEALARRFRPHSTYPLQRGWRDPIVETLFERVTAEPIGAPGDVSPLSYSALHNRRENAS